MYLVAAILLFITCIIAFSTLCYRLGSVITTITSFLALLFIAAATLAAQIMFTIYRNVINDSIPVLNVSASLGTTIFAFTWTATACALISFFGFFFGICCGSARTSSRNWREKRDWYSPTRY